MLSATALALMENYGYNLDAALPNVLKVLALLKFKSIERITSKLQFLYATTTKR